MRLTKLIFAGLLAILWSLAGPVHAAAFSVAGGLSDYAEIVEVDCNFEFRPGREFQFPSADEVLQSYGFILWKNKPSLIAEPLDYSLHQGRRGKLSGDMVIRDGIAWFSGVLDDCTRVYAEDASVHSELNRIEHLLFNGKVVFADTYAAARELINHDVIVRGEGLEPRQRLYTAERSRWFGLSDRQILRVVGIDMHRYAHAKGVGPFFLVVENDQGQRGLIKYNPEYLEVPHGVLPIYSTPPARDLATAPLPARASYIGPREDGNQPIPGENGYLLSINRFEREADGHAALLEMQQAGFQARLVARNQADRVIHELQIGGFPSRPLAESMARIVASRFGWIRTPEVKAEVSAAPSASKTRSAR